MTWQPKGSPQDSAEISERSGQVAIRAVGRNLNDQDLESLVKKWLPQLDKYESKSCIVDISSNKLTGTAFLPLLQGLRQNGLSVHKLCLHKNQLGDEATKALSEHIRSQEDPDTLIREIHLSDNRITRKGVLSLLYAVHDCGCYPSEKAKGKAKGGRTALWLRIENNDVEDPVRVLQYSANQGVLVHMDRLSGSRWDAIWGSLAEPYKAEVQVHQAFLQGGRAEGGKTGKGAGKYSGKDFGGWESWEPQWEEEVTKKDPWPPEVATIPQSRFGGSPEVEIQSGSRASRPTAEMSLLLENIQNTAAGRAYTRSRHIIWKKAVAGVRTKLEACADLPPPSPTAQSVGKAVMRDGFEKRTENLAGALLGEEVTGNLVDLCISDANLSALFEELGLTDAPDAPQSETARACEVRETVGQLADARKPYAQVALDALLDFAVLLGCASIKLPLPSESNASHSNGTWGSKGKSTGKGKGGSKDTADYQ